MREVRTQAAFDRIRAEGRGVVFNWFTQEGASVDGNRLHAASCQWLERANVNVRKVFFDDAASARGWLERNVGPEGVRWFRCATCAAEDGPEASESPPAYTVAELTRQLARFERALRAADLREGSVRTYVDRTAIFLRWLDGDYAPRGPVAR